MTCIANYYIKKCRVKTNFGQCILSTQKQYFSTVRFQPYLSILNKHVFSFIKPLLFGALGSVGCTPHITI